jgi:hypothetical protein
MTIGLTIKVGTDSQASQSFLLFHAAFLDKVALALENVVGPAVGRLGDKLKFLFPTMA